MVERGPLSKPHERRRNTRSGAIGGIQVKRPQRPRTLKGEARAEWDRVVPELEEMGVLSTADRSLLIRYCQTWADWCELDAELRLTGMLVRGRHSGLVRNPLWLMRHDAAVELAELARQLLLAPAWRLRAGIVHVAEEEDGEKTATLTTMAKYRQALDG